MIIEFYANLSESIFLNKNIALLETIEGTLREPTSVTDPVFQISGYNESFLRTNYCWIPNFNRYYYITNITSIRRGLWEVKCHVDVLMSYREEILRQTALIARQESEYNLYLDDDKFLVNSQRIVVAKNFPNKMRNGSGTFVVTIAGGQSST